MFAEIPQNLILSTFGAFLIGWMLSSINARISAKHETKQRDPRDDRIRSLEAERRIAKQELDAIKEKLEAIEENLDNASDGIEKRDNVIEHQQGRVESLQHDLKESVKLTRDLRNELTDRAAESIRSEAKLREVETELSVAQASTDLIATGVLDYTAAPDTERDGDQNPSDDAGQQDLSEAAR